MKVTKSMVSAYVKHQLATNPTWALKALLKIYSLQTADEQASGTTSNLNSVGFSGVDSTILSSFAVQFTKWNRLSDKQMALVFKKMPRYSKQIINSIPESNMTKVESDALEFSKNEVDPEITITNP